MISYILSYTKNYKNHIYEQETRQVHYFVLFNVHNIVCDNKLYSCIILIDKKECYIFLFKHKMNDKY